MSYFIVKVLINCQVAEEGGGEQEERIDQLLKQKREFEEQLKDFEERISEAEG